MSCGQTLVANGVKKHCQIPTRCVAGCRNGRDPRRSALLAFLTRTRYHAANPDLTFLSWATLGSDRIRLIEGKDGRIVEIQGTPDMVLEIVSKSSEYKDAVLLRKAYWEAGIREYWLVDARRELRFDILRHSARRYVATRKQDGWLKSAVFGKGFRLKAATIKQGQPDYTLHVR